MPSPTHIMHVRDSSGIYGAERVILTLAQNIDRNRFRFSLLCMRRRDGRSEQLIKTAKKMGIEVFTVDVNRRFDFRAIYTIRQIVNRQNVSVVHSHDFKSDLYCLLASLNRNIRRVATAHGSTRDSIMKKFYLFVTEHIIYRLFHHIVAVSDDLEKYLISLHLPKNSITLIQNGIDFSILDYDPPITPGTPLPFLNGKKVFSVIGRLYPDKGHRYFLEAFETVHRSFSETAALIVGDGPEKENISALIDRYGLTDSVFACGVREDMRTVYANSDYVVIPSLTEGLPYVLLETMASSIPVIATAVGDIPLLVKHNYTGFLVPPKDSGALAEHMIKLISDPLAADQMATNGRHLVEDEFSANSMVKATESLYRKAVYGT